MTNYLHTAFGNVGTSFPWSIRAVSVSSDSESAAEAAWHAGWAAFWANASLIALYPTTTTWLGTSTSTASAAFKQTTKTTTTASVAGTGAAAANPGQVCLIATLRTANATKWGRGRWYLPAPDSGAMATSDIVFSTAFMGDAQTAMNSAFTNWSSALTFQILHRKATLSGPGALTLTPVTGMDLSDKPAVQRRRSDKRSPARSTVTL